MVRVKAFIFHMSIPCDKTFLLVSSSSSLKVSVEYKGHNFQKIAVAGALVFHKYILLLLKCLSLTIVGYVANVDQNQVAEKIQPDP